MRGCRAVMEVDTWNIYDKEVGWLNWKIWIRMVVLARKGTGLQFQHVPPPRNHLEKYVAIDSIIYT